MTTKELLAKANAVTANEVRSEQIGGAESPVSYISLCRGQSKALIEGHKNHIPGIGLNDFYVQDPKQVLGKKIQFVIVGFVDCYNEYESYDPNADWGGTWSREDSDKYPSVEGRFFDKQLPNGHVLRQTGWLVVKLLKGEFEKPTVIAMSKTSIFDFMEIRNQANVLKDEKGLAYNQMVWEATAKQVTSKDGKHSWAAMDIQFKDVLYTIEGDELKSKASEELLGDILDYARGFQVAMDSKQLIAPRVAQISAPKVELVEAKYDEENEELVF